MIMHTWMHWFWITTVYFRGVLPLTGSTISPSSVTHLAVAEAGLADDETDPVTPASYNVTESSQMGSVETTRRQASEEEPATSEDPPKSTSDVEDVHAGGFQYPMKKFGKHSHLKYGKGRGKGRGEEEGGGVESVRLLEEKFNVNVSTESSTEGETWEVATSDAPIGKSDDEASEEAGNETNATDALPRATEREVEVPNNETLVIESKVEERGTPTTAEPFAVRNRVAAATSAQNYEAERSEMTAGSITGITLGILVVFSLFGAVSFVFYRRRYLNKPQVLHDKCSNLDSSGYIDETSLKENSEEMYSLDNDSFLNSLEAMTIQNYWTESVKHTKL